MSDTTQVVSCMRWVNHRIIHGPEPRYISLALGNCIASL